MLKKLLAPVQFISLLHSALTLCHGHVDHKTLLCMLQMGLRQHVNILLVARSGDGSLVLLSGRAGESTGTLAPGTLWLQTCGAVCL